MLSHENTVVNHESAAQSDYLRFWTEMMPVDVPKRSFWAHWRHLGAQIAPQTDAKVIFDRSIFSCTTPSPMARVGNPPPHPPETEKPSSELQLQPQNNIALAPAREHGKSPDSVPDRRRTAARDRMLQSKANVSNILDPNGHKPIIIREVYIYDFRHKPPCLQK